MLAKIITLQINIFIVRTAKKSGIINDNTITITFIINLVLEK